METVHNPSNESLRERSLWPFITMPLTPRFSWEQDTITIVLRVTVPGAALKDADVYLSDVLIKVNATPYVLVLDLFESVDYSSPLVKRDASTHVLHIAIKKAEAKLWHQLCYDAAKNQLTDRRRASMERKRQKDAQLAEKRKDRKHNEEKQTLRAQMAVDDTNRQILADLKADEKEREERAMYESFKDLMIKQLERSRGPPKALRSEVEHTIAKRDNSSSCLSNFKRVSFAELPEATRMGNTSTNVERNTSTEILEVSEDGSFDTCVTLGFVRNAEIDGFFSTVDIDCGDIQADSMAQEDKLPFYVAQQDSGVEIIRIPPPRTSVQAEIEFTPRLFPTPSRESKAAEEEDWMLKNRKHLKKHNALRGVTEAYDISESDPAWLKAKGDEFYRSQDVRSALNAYTEAISASDNNQTELLIGCLSNRAACHLQSFSFKNCLDDCTTALSYLPDTPAAVGAPSSDDSNHARVILDFHLKLKLLVRRGTALCRLGKVTEAKADYGVALTMDKNNCALQHDYHQLVILERSMQMKERGDEAFNQSRIEDAITHYSECLKLHPHSITSLSNRAVCFLRRHEHQQCIDDCTAALRLLQQNPIACSDSSISGIALSAAGPAPGSAKRRAWVIKTLVRRGTAHAAMKQMKLAEVDFVAANALDPSNKSLQDDLGKVRQRLPKDDRSSSQVVHPEAATILNV